MKLSSPRRSTVVATCLAALATGAIGIGPAAASPATTHSAEAREPLIQLLGASKDYVLYAVNEHDYVKSTRGGKPIKINGFSNSQQIVGSFLIYTAPHAMNSDQVYRDLATGATGKVPARWQTATPDGGAYTALDRTDGKIHGYSQDAATRAVTDYGPLPGFAAPSSDVGEGASADDYGISFRQGSQRSKTFITDYVSYVHPGKVVRLDMHGLGNYARCSTTSSAMACANTYLDKHSSGFHTKSQIVRIPLDGSPQQKPIAVNLPDLPEAAHPYIVPEVTSARTAWTFGLDTDDNYGGPDPAFRLHSVPASSPGGHRTSSNFTIQYAALLINGGNRIFVAQARTASSAGIYRVGLDGKSQKLLVHI